MIELTLDEQPASLDTHHIEGYARAALERGQDGRFGVPLVSHIIDNLYVGGCIDGVRLPDDFRFVISLYRSQRYVMGPHTGWLEIEMHDIAELPDPHFLDFIGRVAAHCAQRGKTLIHCQAGLNRSNLIAALALRERGYTSTAAIALLRAKRSPVVLCNQTFEDYLLSLDSAA